MSDQDLLVLQMNENMCYVLHDGEEEKWTLSVIGNKCLVTGLSADKESYYRFIGRYYRRAVKYDDDRYGHREIWYPCVYYYGDEDYYTFSLRNDRWTIEDSTRDISESVVYENLLYNRYILKPLKYPILQPNRILVESSKYPNILCTFKSELYSMFGSRVILVPDHTYYKIGLEIHPTITACHELIHYTDSWLAYV